MAIAIADGSRVTDKIPCWTHVPIPEQERHVHSFFSVTATGINTDLAKNSGGNLYVVTGNASRSRTLINRLAIEPLNGAPVTATTVQPFLTDMYVNDIPSYCVNYGQPQHFFALDGALTYAIRNHSSQAFSTIFLPAINLPLRSNKRNIGVKSVPIYIAPLLTATVSSLIQHTVSGAWMLGTTQGVYINE